MYRLLIFSTILALLVQTGYSQHPSQAKGDMFFELEQYEKAIKQYQKVLKSDADNLEAKKQIALSYYYWGQPEASLGWFKQVITHPDADPEMMFWYAEALKSSGKYEEAKAYYLQYAEFGTDPEKGKKYAAYLDEIADIKAGEKQYQIRPVPFNSPESDFGPYSHESNLIFVSNRKRGFFVRLFSGGKLFYDLYQVNPRLPDAKPKLMKGKVNSKLHDGLAVIGPGGKIMYFTRSNLKGGKLTRGENGFVNLKIMSAENVNGKWENITSLPFNYDNYSTAHPTLSADGQWMIFASDMKGGYGGMDLYMVRMTEKGWGQPKNLGPAVNTPRDEVFPYLHKDGVLFFSSSGHGGLGGLDIFEALYIDGLWQQVRNAGYPLNSSKDDFGVSFQADRPDGYFSSNRAGGQGDDDIYYFNRKLPFVITVKDKFSEKPVPGTEVRIMDMNGKVETFTTDEQGQLVYYTSVEQEFKASTSKEDYKPAEERFSTAGASPVKRIYEEIIIEKEFMLAGEVIDSSSMEPVSGAQVRIVENGVDFSVVTDADGRYEFNLKPDAEYFVIIKKKGYVPAVETFDTEGKSSESLILKTYLVPGSAIFVEGKTILKKDGSPVGGVNVRAVKEGIANHAQLTQSAKTGKYYMVLKPGHNYTIFGTKKDYFATRVEIPAQDSAWSDTTIYADLEMIDFEVGALVEKIFFDYDKSDIRQRATAELNQIAYFLIDNPQAKVELSAHTDSRGSAGYNQKLSQKRAEAAVEFIISVGVDKERITAKGYGESQLVNECKDGANCTEEMHQLNRRVEIRVTEIVEE